MSVIPFDALTVTFEVSWSTAWNATPSYTDESAYVKSFQTKRGRRSQFDQFPAGTLTIELENSTRRFDPTYASSPLFGNLVPRRKCRLSFTYNAVTYRAFTGYIDGLAQYGELSNQLGWCTLTASDGIKILSRAKLPTGDATVGDGETISARMGRLLDYAAWPASARDIDTNSPTTIRLVENGGGILEQIYQATAGDFGQFFIAGDGDATYRGRGWQLTNNLAAAYTIGELTTSSEIPYNGVTFTYDDTLIFNRAMIRSWTGDETTGFTEDSIDISDATSITAYGESVKDLGSTGLNNLNVAQNTAEWILAYFKDPKLRVTQVSFNPRPLASTIYPPVLSAEIGTRWTFKRRPQNVGSAISQDVIVEGVGYSMTPDTFSAAFDLSQASAAPNGGTYWLMGSGKWTTGSPAATWA